MMFDKLLGKTYTSGATPALAGGAREAACSVHGSAPRSRNGVR